MTTAIEKERQRNMIYEAMAKAFIIIGLAAIAVYAFLIIKALIPKKRRYKKR